MPCLASPPGIHLPLALNRPYPLITDTMWWAFMNSSPKAPAMGRGLSVTLGAPGHLPIAKSVPCHIYNPFRAILPHQPEGLGDVKMFHSGIAFLLVSIKEGVAGDRLYGLSMIWVNPYQARVSTVEETVKQLTALVSNGPDWPYALVQLNGDTCHVPLPRGGTWASCQKKAPAVPPAEGSAN